MDKRIESLRVGDMVTVKGLSVLCYRNGNSVEYSVEIPRGIRTLDLVFHSVKSLIRWLEAR